MPERRHLFPADTGVILKYLHRRQDDGGNTNLLNVQGKRKRGFHKRISKPYQRLLGSGRAVGTLPIRAKWKTGLNLKIKDEEQQLTCLPTGNIALNAQCNLIFQNYDHKHLRLVFDNIKWTIKIAGGMCLALVGKMAVKSMGGGWLESHHGWTGPPDTVRTCPGTQSLQVQPHFPKTHSLASRKLLICVSWAFIGWIMLKRVERSTPHLCPPPTVLLHLLEL